MIRIEKCPPQAVPSRRASAVSQVLKVIHDEEGIPITDAKTSAMDALYRFPMLAAGSQETRELAFRMAYQVYKKKGYISGDTNGLLSAPYDARPDTLVALALDSAHVPAGTVTLVFDSSEGLPCDEIFNQELSTLRRGGRWLVEVTRLAIDDAFANSKDLLALLCNIPFAFASRVRGYTDLLLEVNPRHVPFYRRLLKFQVIGSERPCPRVNGAPAVLLRANLEEYVDEMRRLKDCAFSSTERSLFPQFLQEREEIAQMERLASQQRPMTIAEMRRFGLERPGSLRAEMAAFSGLVARSA